VIYADQRWIGDHGIGRFARHVLAGLNFRPIPVASHPAAPLDAWRLSRALGELTRNDLFFSPGYNSPLVCVAPFVFTIHDLGHIFCPENSSPMIRLYYKTVLKRACYRAVSILTVSEFTRMQIVDWSGVPPAKVFNVGCGVDPAYRPEGNAYGLAFPYLLCVSNRKRHKNEFRVVEAFAGARLAPEIHLVFTGEPTADITDHVRKCRVTNHVDFVGLVLGEQLPSLYRGAEALIFRILPSRAAGQARGSSQLAEKSFRPGPQASSLRCEPASSYESLLPCCANQKPTTAYTVLGSVMETVTS
jgi:glycosyltransferase involved in cell wall biosynthesis